LLNQPLLIASTHANIYEYDGVTTTVWGSLAGMEAYGIAWDHNTNVLVTDYSAQKVQRFSINGSYLGVFGDTSCCGSPHYLTYGPGGNVYVTTSGNNVRRYSPTGVDLGNFVAGGSGGLSDPEGLTFAPNGDLLVVDRPNNLVRRYNGSTGAYIGDFQSGFLNDPYGITISGTNVLVVSRLGSSSINEFNLYSGNYEATLVSYPSGHADVPLGIAIGPEDGKVYLGKATIGDTPRGVRRYFPDGTFDSQVVSFTTLDNGSDLVFIPEPTSLLLIGLGGITVFWRLRRSGN
jgi:hypothetical protein